MFPPTLRFTLQLADVYCRGSARIATTPPASFAGSPGNAANRPPNGIQSFNASSFNTTASPQAIQGLVGSYEQEQQQRFAAPHADPAPLFFADPIGKRASTVAAGAPPGSENRGAAGDDCDSDSEVELARAAGIDIADDDGAKPLRPSLFGYATTAASTAGNAALASRLAHPMSAVFNVLVSGAVLKMGVPDPAATLHLHSPASPPDRFSEGRWIRVAPAYVADCTVVDGCYRGRRGPRPPQWHGPHRRSSC